MNERKEKRLGAGVGGSWKKMKQLFLLMFSILQ